MEYRTDDGKIMEISYSQKLQRNIVVVGVVLAVLLVILIVLFGLLLSGGTLTKILHNVVC
jgi:hypothetical protein